MTQLSPVCMPISPHLSDVVTPVSVYLKLRDLYPNTLLLESSDYHGHRNAMSFICFAPIAEFRVEEECICQYYPQSPETREPITETHTVPAALNAFIQSFRTTPTEVPLPANGIFGYTAYDATQYFEQITLQQGSHLPYAIPAMRYAVYRNIIAFNHFSNRMTLIENLTPDDSSEADKLLSLLVNHTVPAFGFTGAKNETTNVTDQAFLDMVEQGKRHCYRGDVFQIVLSRQFQTHFTGDEFNVYRALRHINPSPYLFYFDYGSYRIMGSSPEAQLIVRQGEATINPIAGTFKRTGNDLRDKELAEELSRDPKENAEHVMLVDLARNDLSRHCRKVTVKTYKEVQYYSHVLHMVSEVTGKLISGATTPGVMAATFPAGTLSGAPKFKAMQLIDRIENQSRGFYGGCIGYMGFDGSFNQAILIRSFLSKGNVLYCQAGAGVVSESVPENELQEVNNKLGALKKAIELAETF